MMYMVGFFGRRLFQQDGTICNEKLVDSVNCIALVWNPVNHIRNIFAPMTDGYRTCVITGLDSYWLTINPTCINARNTAGM